MRHDIVGLLSKSGFGRRTHRVPSGTKDRSGTRFKIIQSPEGATLSWPPYAPELLCFGSDVLRPEHLVRADCSSIQEGQLANLGHAIPARPVLLMKFHEPQCTFDRLFFRLQFKHRNPTEDFLSLGECPVSHAKLSSRQPDTRPRCS